MLLRSGVRGAEVAEFKARHEEISKEITRYLKRVRKESGSFRYLIVCEAHKSGMPHYHGLIHEHGNRVRWDALHDQWTLGISEIVLVKDGDLYKEVYWEHGKRKWRWTAEPLAAGQIARYCAKYLSKSVLARVRASQAYGDGTEQVVLEHNEEPKNPVESVGHTGVGPTCGGGLPKAGVGTAVWKSDHKKEAGAA